MMAPKNDVVATVTSTRCPLGARRKWEDGQGPGEVKYGLPYAA